MWENLRLFVSTASLTFILIPLPFIVLLVTWGGGLSPIEYLTAGIGYAAGWGVAALPFRRSLIREPASPTWSDVLLYSFLAAGLGPLAMMCFMLAVSQHSSSSLTGDQISVVFAIACIGTLPLGLILFPIAGGILIAQRTMSERFGFPLRINHEPETTRRCATCGYDLRANLSGTCPECGRPSDS